MRGTLVDSNVLLDMFTEDEDWFDWSTAMIARAAERGQLVINPIIYAEISAQFDSLEDLDAALPPAYYRRADLPWAAAFLASRAFVEYRRAGGARRSPLPDFYIGAHAAVEGLTLLTRDPGRYRRYFRALTIIEP